jgi:3-mercaptopyruvate sulfurtransferase SseA
MLDDNGRLRPTPQLREMLAAKNLKPGEEVVVYCQSGGRASLAALAAVRAGYTNVTNYYMSMGEWLGDESCPIQK